MEWGFFDWFQARSAAVRQFAGYLLSGSHGLAEEIVRKGRLTVKGLCCGLKVALVWAERRPGLRPDWVGGWEMMLRGVEVAARDGLPSIGEKDFATALSCALEHDEWYTAAGKVYCQRCMAVVKCS